MSEYIEVDGQEIEKTEYILSDSDRQNGEQEPRVTIDVQGESIRSGKTKALIIIMPQYLNDIPQIINVGLDLKTIQKAIEIADESFFDTTYKQEIQWLEDKVARLQIKLNAAEEKIGEVEQ